MEDREKFFEEFNNGLHRIGRIMLILSVILLLSVPFIYGAVNGVSVDVKLKEEFTIKEIIDEFKKHKNIVLCDKISPSSVLSCKNDKVYVGRIRKHKNRLLLYCVADNIRVGAATNAYLILKHLLKGNYE